MTDKAEYILEKIRGRSRRRGNRGFGNSILDEFNKSTLDDVGPVGGGDKEMKVLNEMNELEDISREGGNSQN